MTRHVQHSAVRGRSWGILSAAAGSAGNFLLGVAYARQSSSVQFGHFSVLFAGYVVALMWHRGHQLLPFVISVNDSANATFQPTVALIQKASRTGLLLGFLLCLLGISRSSGLTLSLLFGGSIVVLLPLDALRYSFSANQQVMSTAKVDIYWLIFQLVISVPVVVFEGRPELLVLAWAASGGFVLAAQLPHRISCAEARPAPAHVASYSYGFELASGGMLDLLVYLIVGSVSLAAVGEYRATIMAFGPLSMIASGLMLVTLPRLLRADDRRARLLPHEARTYLLLNILCTLAVTLVLTCIPYGALRSLLGASAPSSRGLILLIGAYFVMLASNTTITLIFRVYDDRRAALISRLIGIICALLLAATVGRSSPPVSLAMTQLIAATATTLASFLLLLRRLRVIDES